MLFCVVENLLAKAGSGKFVDAIERNFVDGRAGWGEGDGDAVVFLADGAQGPDFALEGFEVLLERAAARRVQEGAGYFFFGVICAVGVAEVEGEGLS